MSDWNEWQKSEDIYQLISITDSAVVAKDF